MITAAAPYTGISRLDELDEVVLEDVSSDPIAGQKEARNQFKRLLNSLIFRSGQNKIKIEQPKLFERTFTVHVDPDEYTIDITKTESTPKGRAALGNLKLTDSTINETSPKGDVIMKIKPRSKNEGNFEFSEFFAVVALGADD